MNQFNSEIKSMLKKIDQEILSEEDLLQLIDVCYEKVAEFHLYSLGLKYYSFRERNQDFEDDFEDDEHEYEHEHEHKHEHDHEHADCAYDESIKSEQLDVIFTTMEDYIKNLSKTGSSVHLNELLSVSMELKQFVNVLTAYGDQIAFLESVYFKTRYVDDKLIALDTDESFSQRVVEILMAEGNSAEIREHLRYIYPELPMRMTKNKFYSYVDQYFKMLQGINFDDVKNHVQLLRETFNPKVVEGYGAYVNEVALELDKVEQTLINGTAGEKDSAYHFLYHLSEDKNDLLETGLDLAELLNHLIGISLCELNTEDNRVFKVFNRLIDAEVKEDELATLFEDIESNYEPLGEDLIKVSQVIERLNEKESLVETFGKTYKISELNYAYALIRDGYFIDRPSKKDETIPTLLELATIKNELIELMDTTFAKENRVFRRSRMSLMMSVFQIVHSTGQQIHDYIYQAVSSCDQKGEKIVSMQNIYSYLNDLAD